MACGFVGVTHVADMGEGGQKSMTQDEKWQAKYDEVVAFIKNNHRNPSKYIDE